MRPQSSEVLADLLRSGWERAELFCKRGRSQRFELTSLGLITSHHEERGWSVRVGDDEKSFFFAASGLPRPIEDWPQAVKGELRLPEAWASGPWEEPSEMDRPLLGEGEGRRFFESLCRGVEEEMPGSRVHRGLLEDGSSEASVRNSFGVDVCFRGRVASLYVEAEGPPPRRAGWALRVAAREARGLCPDALARRLVDLLVVGKDGEATHAHGEMVLAPEVMAQLLAGLVPLFVESSRERIAGAFSRGDPSIAPAMVTLVDDGGLENGILTAPVDGEGVPTRRRTLIEEGRLNEPILPWWRSHTPVGCRLRPGWRDLPATGATHFFLVPQEEVTAASLVTDLARGYYVIGGEGSGHFDLDGGSFSLPVRGFEVVAGRPLQPFSDTLLVGRLGGLLAGIRGIARDLRFLPTRGMVGSPSVLVEGLRLRPAR